MTVFIYTLGCKLNQCESEAIADAFTHQGFEVVSSDQKADLYIVNTCTVTSKAEQKARRMIRKYANEEQKPVVLVSGCYAQMEKEELQNLHKRVVVVSLDDKPLLLQLPLFLSHTHIASIDLLEAVKEFALRNEQKESSPFDYDAASFSVHSRAFVKIQDGCDNRCAYCRVSLARGAAVSLEYQQVLQRIAALQEQGYAEIVLTGVNISAYQSDDVDLAKLLKLLLAQSGASVRFRLSSLEPDRLDAPLIELFSDYRIQPHFHLPVQSASDVVLKRVNRHYDVKRLYEAVSLLRQVKNDPFIAADMISGLPGETEEEFEKSYRVIKELDFSQLHVFPFSPRPQTPLFAAKDRVPEYVRDQRAKKLRALSAIHYRRYMGRQIGQEGEVILEQIQDDSSWRGISGNYLHVVVEDVPNQLKRGALVPVIFEKQAAQIVPIARLRYA